MTLDVKTMWIDLEQQKAKNALLQSLVTQLCHLLLERGVVSQAELVDMSEVAVKHCEDVTGQDLLDLMPRRG